MKKLTLIALTLIASNLWLKGSDTLNLFNGKFYSGEVLDVKKHSIVFLGDNGEKFKIPLEHVYGIYFEDSESDIALKFEACTDEYLMQVTNTYLTGEVSDNLAPSNMEKYMQGQSDAKIYHGKGFGYGVAGFLLGPFGYLFLIGDSKFMPQNASSAAAFINDRDLNDWEYIEGYKKKARGKQAGNVTIGWAAWIALVLLL